MEETKHIESNNSNTFVQIIIRLVVSGVVLAVTAFFTPGFSISNIWTLILAAVVLTILDYAITKLTGLDASPFGKGFVGFILAAIILYVIKFFVAGYNITLIAAIIGALIYGVVDYFIPGTRTM